MTTQDQFDVFAFAGQSNVDGHFFRRDGDTSEPLGSEVFEARLAELTGVQAQTINTASGGSASNQNVVTPFTTGQNFWWDIVNDAPGPLLIAAIANIRAGLSDGQDLDGLIWGQGEEDADAIFYGADADATIADLVESTANIFATFRAEFGADLPILVQELGDFPATLPGTENGFDLVREAQAQIIAGDDNIFLAADADVDDIELLPDNIHYTTESYGILADQLAESVAEVINGDPISIEQPVAGPVVPTTIDFEGLISDYAVFERADGTFFVEQLATDTIFELAGISSVTVEGQTFGIDIVQSVAEPAPVIVDPEPVTELTLDGLISDYLVFENTDGSFFVETIATNETFDLTGIENVTVEGQTFDIATVQSVAEPVPMIVVDPAPVEPMIVVDPAPVEPAIEVEAIYMHEEDHFFADIFDAFDIDFGVGIFH